MPVFEAQDIKTPASRETKNIIAPITSHLLIFLVYLPCWNLQEGIASGDISLHNDVMRKKWKKLFVPVLVLGVVVVAALMVFSRTRTKNDVPVVQEETAYTDIFKAALFSGTSLTK